MAKKASVTIQGVEAANKKISELIEKIGKSEELYTFIGDNVKTQITNRTKTNKESYKQPSLQPVTIEARKLLEQAGNSTGKGYGASKSNLTFSGQLLNSIKYALNTASGNIKFYLNDYRYNLIKPTKDQAQQYYNTMLDKDRNFSNNKYLSEMGLSTKTIDKGLAKKEREQLKSQAYWMLVNSKEKNKTNNQIKDDLEAKGRKFFFISQDVITQVENQLTRWFKREKANLIKKYLKK